MNNKHLDLLAIFYFVLGGLTALNALVFTGVKGEMNQTMSAQPNPISSLLQLTVLFLIIATVLLILAGINLKKRKNYTFVQVAAAITCLGFPVGTILGVCTLIAINAPESKSEFGVEEGAAPPPSL
jgi:uncharacterized membrane protein